MADQDFPLLRAFIEVDAKKAKREIASLRTAVKALKRDLENLPKRINLDSRFAKPFKDSAKSVNELNRGLDRASRNLSRASRQAQQISRALVPLGQVPIFAGPPGGRSLVPAGGRGLAVPPAGPLVPAGREVSLRGANIAFRIDPNATVQVLGAEVFRRQAGQIPFTPGTGLATRGPRGFNLGGRGFSFPFAQNLIGGTSAITPNQVRPQGQLLLTDRRGIRRLADEIARVRIPPPSARFPTFARFGQAAFRGAGNVLGSAAIGGFGGGGAGGRRNFRGITLPAIFGTFAAASFTQDSLKLATAIEKTTFALEKLTDSEPELESLFKSLRKLAFETTTDFTELLPSAQKLLGSGFGAGEVEPLLRQLADLSIITSANGVSFGRLVDVVARNNLQFRLLTRDVREFTNAGLNILPSLQRQLGVANFEEVFDAIRKGEVNINNLRQAITDLTSTGGIAFNLQADAANTAFLAFDKLKEEINITKQAFGDFIIEDLGVKSAAEVAVQALRDLRGEVRLTAQGVPETAGQAILRRQAQGRGITEGITEGTTAELLRQARIANLTIQAANTLTTGGQRGAFTGLFRLLAGPLFQRRPLALDEGFEEIRQERLQLAEDARRRARVTEDPVERQNLIDLATVLEDDARILAEKIRSGLKEIRDAINVEDPVGAKERKRARERQARNEKAERLQFLREDLGRLQERLAGGLTEFDQGIVEDLIARRLADIDRLTGRPGRRGFGIPSTPFDLNQLVTRGGRGGRGFRAEGFSFEFNPITEEGTFTAAPGQVRGRDLTPTGAALVGAVGRNIPEILGAALETGLTAASRAGPFVGLVRETIEQAPTRGRGLLQRLPDIFEAQARANVSAQAASTAFLAFRANAPAAIIEPIKTFLSAREARAEEDRVNVGQQFAQNLVATGFNNAVLKLSEAGAALSQAARSLEKAPVTKLEGPEAGPE